MIPKPDCVPAARAAKLQREVKAAEDMLRQLKTRTPFLLGSTDDYAVHIDVKDSHIADSPTTVVSSPRTRETAAAVKGKVPAYESAAASSFLNSAEGRYSVGRVTFRHVVVKRCLDGRSSLQQPQHIGKCSIRGRANETPHCASLELLEKKLLKLLPGSVVEACNEEFYEVPLEIADQLNIESCEAAPDQGVVPQDGQQHQEQQVEPQEYPQPQKQRLQQDKQQAGQRETPQSSKRQQRVLHGKPHMQRDKMPSQQDLLQEEAPLSHLRPRKQQQQSQPQQVEPHAVAAEKLEETDPEKGSDCEVEAESVGPYGSRAPPPAGIMSVLVESDGTATAVASARTVALHQQTKEGQRNVNKRSQSVFCVRSDGKTVHPSMAMAGFQQENPGGVTPTTSTAISVQRSRPAQASKAAGSLSHPRTVYVKLKTLEDLNSVDVQQLERL